MRLQINQALGVQIVATAAPFTETDTNGIVVSLTSDAITIRLPELDAPVDGLTSNGTIRLRVTNSQGLHVAEVKVLQVVSAPFVSVTVSPPRRFETTQQREFFRVAVRMPVTCTLVKPAGGEAQGSVDTSASTEDISAGGMRLSTSLPLQLENEVELLLKARNARGVETTLTLRAQVLRVLGDSAKAGATRSVGVKFMYANQRQQDALVLLMFELQRRSLA